MKINFIETLKHFFGIVSKYDITDKRGCLSSFLRALSYCDKNNDGSINVSELLRLFKDMSIGMVTSYDLTDDEINLYVKELIKKR